jgi:hypothetical protein
MRREVSAKHLSLTLAGPSDDASSTPLPAIDHTFVPVFQHHRFRIFSCAFARMVLKIIGRPIAFHIANAVLGFVGAIAMAVGVALGLVVVPICGVAVAHSIIEIITALLCRIDIAAHNMIADRAAEQIALLPPSELRVGERSFQIDGKFKRRHASPPPPLVAIMYFGIARAVLALLTSLFLVLLALFAYALSHDHITTNVPITDRSGEKLKIGLWIYIECFAGAVVSSFALHAISRVSQATTRACCCELSY